MKFHHPRHMLFFGLLNCMDFLLTWWLLHREDADCVETNPVARGWIDAYGWWGLAIYKLSAVVLTLGICQLVARSRPKVSGRILNFGCMMVFGVVLYSIFLGTQTGDVSNRAELETAQQSCNVLDEKIRGIDRFQQRRTALGEAYLASRMTLKEAFDELEKMAHSHDRYFVAALQRVYTHCDETECRLADFAKCIVFLAYEQSLYLSTAIDRVYADHAREFGKELTLDRESLETCVAAGQPWLVREATCLE